MKKNQTLQFISQSFSVIYILPHPLCSRHHKLITAIYTCLALLFIYSVPELDPVYETSSKPNPKGMSFIKSSPSYCLFYSLKPVLTPKALSSYTTAFSSTALYHRHWSTYISLTRMLYPVWIFDPQNLHA